MEIDMISCLICMKFETPENTCLNSFSTITPMAESEINLHIIHLGSSYIQRDHILIDFTRKLTSHESLKENYLFISLFIHLNSSLIEDQFWIRHWGILRWMRCSLFPKRLFKSSFLCNINSSSVNMLESSFNKTTLNICHSTETHNWTHSFWWCVQAEQREKETKS